MDHQSPNSPRSKTQQSAWDLAAIWPYPAIFDPYGERPKVINWTSGDGKNLRTGRIDYPLKTYVDAVGLDVAAKFLFVFGGKNIFLADPKNRHPDVANVPPRPSQLYQALGAEAEYALRRAVYPTLSNPMKFLVPTGHAFLTKYLRHKGEPIAQIASILRLSQVTVTVFLLSDDQRAVARVKTRQKQLQSALNEAEQIGLIKLPSHHKLKPPGAPK